LASLNSQRIQHSARLAALLAWPDQDALPWPTWAPLDSESFNNPSTERTSLLAAVDTQNPELLMLRRKVSSSRARVELARLETRPDLTFGLTYIQVGRPVVNPTTPNAGRDPWGVSLAVNLPIWNQKNSRTRQEASATQRSAENELTERRNQLRADTLVALSAATDANRRVRLYEDDLLPLARQAVDNTLASYQGDRATLLELIDSERSQLDLELQLWRAQADAAQQKLILQTLANQPL
jgi:cobalt-zinc-cadmium efflux system outer membrane protein